MGPHLVGDINHKGQIAAFMGQKFLSVKKELGDLHCPTHAHRYLASLPRFLRGKMSAIPAEALEILPAAGVGGFQAH